MEELHLFNSIVYCYLLCSTVDEAGSTISSIGPNDLPPPYETSTQYDVPKVTCRVCQAMIDISTKRDQHVVKCSQCNEATVRFQSNLIHCETVY